MEGVVILESAAFNRLVNKIDRIEEVIQSTVKSLEEAKKPWMTLAETCEYMSKGTTWLYANKAKIGFSKPGGEILFSRKKVDEYLESRFFQEK